MKPKLLVIELWGVGDLAIATPFLQKAAEQFEVTLLAKPYALDLQQHFFPEIKVIPFSAPWTAFTGKYRVLHWPWGSMISLWKKLYRQKFDVALSARWDPRDHFLLRMTGAKARLGFPRLGSQIFLTNVIAPADPGEHRYENWRRMARTLNLDLKPRSQIESGPERKGRTILIHTGAGQPVRIWPLERYRKLVQHLRERHYEVKVVCNPEQREWWLTAGEKGMETPRTIDDLLELMEPTAVFIGNDSGPGHLAAFCGIPTFTFFGPQVPEWFIPLHPEAEWISGKACPFKPCSDYCRFPAPFCLQDLSDAEVWPRVIRFVERHVRN